ncbi:hypothetical protein NMD10_27675 (plasmid) [Citrobacter portucalensis]|uniref:hypothetical protein n=1 Tax=Citrobacter portucalensis TaxID=1639133 RepID=UPI00351D9C24
MPRKPINPKAPLVGLFAHTFNDEKAVEFQLEITAALPDNHYLCQLYSWMDGSDTNMAIFHIGDMKAWKLYDDVEYWRKEGDRLSKVNR